MKRSLYQCSHARVMKKNVYSVTEIYCDTGRKLDSHPTHEGNLSIKLLVRGKPLELSVCQECPDFSSLGEPIPKGERGWLKI